MAELERIAADTLRMERIFEAPVATVWRWLVEPELCKQWFAGGTAPREGEEFELVFDHDNLSADPVPYPPEYAQWKAAVGRERVVRMEAPRVLAFTWNGGKEGTVAFELLDAGAGQTRLVLIHSGISGPAACTDFGAGWLSHLAVLQARLAGRPVRDFWALHRASQAAVAKLLAGEEAGRSGG